MCPAREALKIEGKGGVMEKRQWHDGQLGDGGEVGQVESRVPVAAVGFNIDEAAPA